MPDPNFFRLQGIPYSWNSCAHLFNGIPYKGLTAVTFKETREVKLVHAAQQDGTPLGITAGMYKVENVSFTLIRSSAHALMADLTAFGLGSYGDVSFTYIMNLFEPPNAGQPDIPTTTIITGCRITGVEEKQELGVDELVTQFDVQALGLTRFFGGGIPLRLNSVVRTLL